MKRDVWFTRTRQLWKRARMEGFFQIDWSLVLSHLLHIAGAYILALPIAWDREATARSAGLRTFPLVGIASCGYVMVGMSVLSGSDAMSRVLYGLMTGIGFIGGGAILKGDGVVKGTATAASIWNTGGVPINGMAGPGDAFADPVHPRVALRTSAERGDIGLVPRNTARLSGTR